MVYPSESWWKSQFSSGHLEEDRRVRAPQGSVDGAEGTDWGVVGYQRLLDREAISTQIAGGEVMTRTSGYQGQGEHRESCRDGRGQVLGKGPGGGTCPPIAPRGFPLALHNLNQTARKLR